MNGGQRGGLAEWIIAIIIGLSVGVFYCLQLYLSK